LLGCFQINHHRFKLFSVYGSGLVNEFGGIFWYLNFVGRECLSDEKSSVFYQRTKHTFFRTHSQ
jgi:hypothetical protein